MFPRLYEILTIFLARELFAELMVVRGSRSMGSLYVENIDQRAVRSTSSLNLNCNGVGSEPRCSLLLTRNHVGGELRGLQLRDYGNLIKLFVDPKMT
jgi:hypothetical protein